MGFGEEFSHWSKHYRDNFDKLLLFFLALALVLLVLHMSHDQADVSQVAWAREITGTVLGGLLGLITGRAIASATSTREEEKKKPDGG